MMNNFILPFQNWRVFLLCVLSMFAVIFLLAEGDNAAAFVAYKLASVALIALIYYLMVRWADDGHFKALKDILNDDNEE